MLNTPLIRELMGDKYRTFCDESGLSHAGYFKLLKSPNPRLTTLLKLSNFLGVSIDTLIIKD